VFLFFGVLFGLFVEMFVLERVFFQVLSRILLCGLCAAILFKTSFLQCSLKQKAQYSTQFVSSLL